MRRVITLTLLLFASFAQSADFDKGFDAYIQGDFKTAYSEWFPLAEQGEASAQFNLALMYLDGQGVTQDDKQAVYWFRKAAAQGLAIAQNNLCLVYLNGKGVTQDYKQAYMWLYLARHNGFKYTKENFHTLNKLMTSSDIIEAQKSSKVCLESNYKKCD